MGVEVVGVGYLASGSCWRDAVRLPWSPSLPLEQLTANVCSLVHELGYQGAAVRIERVRADGERSVLDDGGCSCPLCVSQG